MRVVLALNDIKGKRRAAEQQPADFTLVERRVELPL